MNIRVLRSAHRTIKDGIRFYDLQESGLGAYFLNSIMSDLRSLTVYGGGHQMHDDTPFHRMVCKRFPYSIYYRKEGSNVDVYAVLDDRRDPEWTELMLRKIGL